jgi:phosphatidylglycerol:prolipoprotein diacylglycerol transferase
MFIEGLRTDSLMVGSIRISQLLAFVSCIIGIVLLVVFGTLAKKGKKAEEAVENNTEE